MTNKTIIFGSAIAIALVAGVLSSGMLAEAAPAAKAPQDVFVTNEPLTVTGIVASSPVCPQENVQHWVKATFGVGNNQFVAPDPQLPVIGGSNDEITILTNPDLPSDLDETIGDKLADLGYTRTTDGLAITPSFITIDDMEYSTICAGP